MSSANYGELSLSGDVVSYEPNKDYEGEDRFGYRAYDEEGGYSEVATISITVEGVNDYPEGYASEIGVSEDVKYNLSEEDFGYYDVDGDELAGIVIERLPVTGTLYEELEEITSTGDVYTNVSELYYLSGPNSIATDNFAFRVYDGVYKYGKLRDDGSVGSVNDSPSIEELSVTVNEGGTVTINQVPLIMREMQLMN